MIENHPAGQVWGHDCCANSIPTDPAPANKTSSPCCKTLRIVSVVPAEAPLWNSTGFAGLPSDLVTAVVGLPRSAEAASLFLDTGPPGAGTFAEIVLQRSLLAHAPPLLS